MSTHNRHLHDPRTGYEQHRRRNDDDDDDSGNDQLPRPPKTPAPRNNPSILKTTVAKYLNTYLNQHNHQTSTMADVVPRPAPRTSSPHTFETTQLLRRFPDAHRRLRPSDSAEILTLAISPSDPDFIYPLDALRLELIIPPQYRRATPTPTSIIVLNSDIPPPWKRRIARWWKEAGEERTLLEKVKRLDRELEGLLSAEGDGEGVVLEMRYRAAPKPAPPPAPREPTPPPPPPPPAEVKPVPRVVTATQRAEAAKKRTREVRQLTTRLSREKGFAQLSPTVFTVPVNAQRRHLLPVPLQPLQTVRLMVPLDYDVVPARIEVLGVPREVAAVVEVMWDSYVAGHPEVGLTAAVNVLGAKLHVWACEEREPAPAVVEEEEPEVEEEPEEKDVPLAVEGKPHIQVIARPPEWAPRATDDDGESSSDDSDYDSSSSGDEARDGDEDSPATAAADGSAGSKAEHGTALSVPGIVLNNIDLLEPASLNLTLRCTRCKAEHEVQNLRGTPAGARPTPRAWRCEKCSAVLGIGFRKELVHVNSTRLGCASFRLPTETPAR